MVGNVYPVSMFGVIKKRTTGRMASWNSSSIEKPTTKVGRYLEVIRSDTNTSKMFEKAAIFHRIKNICLLKMKRVFCAHLVIPT
jgi:hypothetical protein